MYTQILLNELFQFLQSLIKYLVVKKKIIETGPFSNVHHKDGLEHTRCEFEVEYISIPKIWNTNCVLHAIPLGDRENFKEYVETPSHKSKRRLILFSFQK